MTAIASGDIVSHSLHDRDGPETRRAETETAPIPSNEPPMSTPLHRMIAALLLLLSVTGCRPTAAPAAIPVPPGDDASHQLRTALAGTSGYGDWAALVEDVSIRDGIAEVATTVAPHRPGRVDGLCALIADVL